jgi:hypothetical protein
MIADELRRQADVFIDLIGLQTKLGREPMERPPARDAHPHSRKGSSVARREDDTDSDY